MVETIQEWNNGLLILFVPLDILLVLFFVLGLFGNALVIFVYRYRMKRIKDGQYFIPYLAVTDLFGSIICSTFGLSMTLMPVTFDLDYLCKSGWFLGSTTTFMSVFLLVTIAIQRYLKVCRQNKPALTLKWKRHLMVLALTMSVALACPSLFTYGSVPFEKYNNNLTGLICGKITGVGSLVYDIIISISVSVSCGLLLVLYFLVGRKTYKYMKRGQNLKVSSCAYECRSDKSKDSDDCTLEYSKSTQDTDLKTDDVIKLNDVVTKNNEPSAKIRDAQEDTNKYIDREVKHPRSELQKTNKRIISKITLMFMIITVVFLLCSLPKMSIVLIETVVPNFWTKFSDSERVAVMFVHQGYILNNVVNPFIYTFLDKAFKAEVKKMC